MNAPLATVIFALALLLVVLGLSVKHVRHGERMLVLRMGQYRRMVGPGWHFILPIIESGTVLNLNEHMPEWAAYSDDQIEARLVAALYRTKPGQPTAAAEPLKPPPEAGQWAFIDGKCRWAPDVSTLRSWAMDGHLPRNAKVWDSERRVWTVATKVRELQSAFYPMPLVVKWRYDLWLALWPFFVLLIGVLGMNLIGLAITELASGDMPGRRESAMVVFSIGVFMVVGAALMLRGRWRRKAATAALRKAPYPEPPAGVSPPPPPSSALDATGRP
jgi:hypothetical protein